MRMWKLISLVLAMFAMPAHAATIIGESEGDFHVDNFGLNLTAPGNYRVSVNFTAPVEELYLAFELLETYNQFFPDDLSTPVGGNDTAVYPSVSNTGPLTSAAFTFAVPAPFAGVDGEFVTFTQFRLTGGTIEFYSDNAVGYSISVDRLGGGAIPEPATWAFLILGFGAIGGAMRASRRRTIQVTYA